MLLAQEFYPSSDVIEGWAELGIAISPQTQHAFILAEGIVRLAETLVELWA